MLSPPTDSFWLAGATNEPSGNNLLTAHVNPNGTLTYAASYSTGGMGLHGAPGDGSDGLFSASSIYVNQDLGLLAVTNVSLLRFRRADLEAWSLAKGI